MKKEWKPRRPKPSVTRLPDDPLAPVIQAYDAAVVGYETKWGMDTLPALVSDDLATRFAAAKDALDEAIQSGDVERVRQAASRMVAGYKALDVAATKNGYQPASVKCIRGFHGHTVISICETDADASMYVAHYPHLAPVTFSADQIARWFQQESESMIAVALNSGSKLASYTAASTLDGRKPPNDPLPPMMGGVPLDKTLNSQTR